MIPTRTLLTFLAVLLATTTFAQTTLTRPRAGAGTNGRGAQDAGNTPSVTAADFSGTNSPALKFENAPAELLLMTYAEVTGKTLLMSPNLKKPNITLKSQPGLTKEEYLRAIETVLVMNDIAFVEDGEKFIRVFPASELRQDGVKTFFEPPEGGAHPEDGTMVSQMITLKSITLDEAKKAIEGFKRKDGIIQTFERTNSILITDTVENVNRMLEIIRFIDQPIVNRDETNVRALKFAKAADVKARLDEIVKQSQEEQQASKTQTSAQSKKSGSPGIVRSNLPGLVRPKSSNTPPQPQATEAIDTMIDDAERGMIKGNVKIIADERTNLLIIITRPENMTFFNRIIDVLDVEVQSTPDVIVEVTRLEYAAAKEVAEMLNDLIGNNDSRKESDKDAKGTVADKSDNRGGSKSLTEASDDLRKATDSKSAQGKGKLGELRKENCKILADERTNAIVIMAAPQDVASILDVIKSMDIQLSQVVIETVIVSVNFEDSQETGMDWVQHAMLASNNNGRRQFTYATAGGGGQYTPQSWNTIDGSGALKSSGGVTGWFTLFDLNMDVILKAIKSDTRSRLMSSPRITTMDNKKASLEDTKRIYWSEGSTHYTSSDYYSDNIKNDDIGIKLNVTPRINKKGYISLTIEQEIQTSEGTQSVITRDSTSTFPNLMTRKMSADVAVQSGETVVLGGLADNSISTIRTKVPILGSIPLLGYLFRYDKEVHSRTEIIVFLTPRVIDTPAQIEDDARNIKASLGTHGIWDSSWSSSRLADPISETERTELIENGRETVAPPRSELSGYLTGLNENPTNEIIKAAQERSPLPYVHFSDVDGIGIDPEEDRQNRIKNANFTSTKEPLNPPPPTPETPSTARKIIE